MSNTLIHLIKIIISGASVMVIFLYLFLQEAPSKIKYKVLTSLLIFLSIASVGAYFNFGYFAKFGGYTNPHDMFHYYVGSKYSKEVGYFNLYNATLVADAEGDRFYKRRVIRDLGNYRFVQVSSILRNAATYRSLFSEKRWNEFVTDVRYFQSKMSVQSFSHVLRDKGYNPTPVWNMVATNISNRIPIGSQAGMNFIASLDLILLLAMIAMIYKAFGLRVFLFSVIFLGTNYFMGMTHSRGSFLRFDWFTFTTMGLCCLKMGKYKTSAILLGYSGMVRVFPFIFLFGIGAKFLWSFIQNRKIDRNYLQFFLVLLFVSLVFFFASVVTGNGFQAWKDFFTKINLHRFDLSAMRIGFEYVFLMTYKNTFGNWNAFESHKLLLFENLKWLWWIIQSGVLLVSFYLVKKLEDYEALAYGFVLTFFLTAPTFYYYAMVIIPLLIFVPKSDDGWGAFGSALIFILSIISIILYRIWGFEIPFCFIVSVLLLIFVIYIMFYCALKYPSTPSLPTDRGPDHAK